MEKIWEESTGKRGERLAGDNFQRRRIGKSNTREKGIKQKKGMLREEE